MLASDSTHVYMLYPFNSCYATRGSTVDPGAYSDACISLYVTRTSPLCRVVALAHFYMFIESRVQFPSFAIVLISTVGCICGRSHILLRLLWRKSQVSLLALQLRRFLLARTKSFQASGSSLSPVALLSIFICWMSVITDPKYVGSALSLLKLWRAI